MTNVFGRAAAVAMICLVMYSASFSVAAEEPTSAPTDSRVLDREGKPIYGAELMTESEISGLKSMLFSIKDPAAREEARAAHRKAMDKRAGDRGVTIKQ